jgi:hypothetical protein
MARPQKEGLDYFPLDTDMDLSDDKIQLLEAKHGIIGFAVLIKLLMKIYGEGYYYPWGEKESLLLSKRVSVDVNKVNDIVNDLIKWEMFHPQLYSKYKILTSNGIQKRFWEVAKRRNEVTIVKQYWVFNVDMILVSVNINVVNVEGVDRGAPSKEKKNKAFIACQHLSMTKEEYEKLVNQYGQATVDDKIEYAQNYAKLKNYKSLYLTLNNWMKKDKARDNHGNSTGSNKSGYDCSKLYYKPKPGGGNDNPEGI